MKKDFRFKKYGALTNSNIKWTYNLDPMKKWITILFGAIALAGSVWMIRQDMVEKQVKEAAKIEAKQERGKYLERRLEIIKQETIAAELAWQKRKSHTINPAASPHEGTNQAHQFTPGQTSKQEPSIPTYQRFDKLYLPNLS